MNDSQVERIFGIVRGARQRYQPYQLVFFKFSDLETNFHLGNVCDGTIKTACGIRLASGSEPVFHSINEPSGMAACPMCATKASEFSKHNFGGRKLNYTKPRGVAATITEEAYEKYGRSRADLYKATSFTFNGQELEYQSPPKYPNPSNGNAADKWSPEDVPF